MTYCYSMTMDAIYEEHRSDWSHHVSAVVATRLQCDKTLPLCIVLQMYFQTGFLTPRIAMFSGIENYLSACMSCCSDDLPLLLPH